MFILMLFVEEAEEKKENKFKAKEIDWLYASVLD